MICVTDVYFCVCAIAGTVGVGNSNKMAGEKDVHFPKRDPWARVEAWRYAPDINKRANIKRMFPGLGWGIAAFLVLTAVEEFYWKPRHALKDVHH